MIEIDGPLWFLGAVLVCGTHALYLCGWRREQRQYQAWWQNYDTKAQKRHDDFMRAIDDGGDADVSWDLYKSERGQA